MIDRWSCECGKTIDIRMDPGDSPKGEQAIAAGWVKGRDRWLCSEACWQRNLEPAGILRGASQEARRLDGLRRAGWQATSAPSRLVYHWKTVDDVKVVDLERWLNENAREYVAGRSLVMGVAESAEWMVYAIPDVHGEHAKIILRRVVLADGSMDRAFSSDGNFRDPIVRPCCSESLDGGHAPDCPAR